MIALACNVARRVGLRAAADVILMIFMFLNLKADTPHWTSIRTWLMRVGLAMTEQLVEAADDWIWFADHSNQIGPEKVLVILGIRASQLPPAGQPLKHENLRVLAVIPGTSWNTEAVARAYSELAERSGGAPRAVLVDGAAELRDAVEVLRKLRPDCIVLGDFKHYAANVLKKELGRNERFAEFTSLVGRVRSSIQQTELAHLTPPGARPKARFMNLATQLRWARLMLWVLEHPEAKCRTGLDAERLTDKLGELVAFKDDIAEWNECQRVICMGVTYINKQGLKHGAASELEALLVADSRQRGVSCEPATTPKADDVSQSSWQRVQNQLLSFLRQSENQLREGERLPLSTEILESSFGLYKQLEGQHSKSGFTSLLSAFGALLKPQTAESIRECLSRVSVKQLKKWQEKHFAHTLKSKRQTVTQEFAAATRSAT